MRTTNKVSEKTHAEEIADGERFSFGKNWAQFLKVLDDQRIQQAVDSLKTMLEVESLSGKSFLDIGSGSGLFSLAAKRLGAKVLSFDYDPHSVACTKELKRRYYDNDNDWHVQTGSVLDINYLSSLGKFDIVYSWGVLHHTGDLWSALANVDGSVADKGKLFIALYNDQGRSSKIWWVIKKNYVSLPEYLRWLILIPCYIRLWGPTTIRDLLLFRPFNDWRTYKKNRGMSPHRDVVDWVGGFPFEVSKPEQIFDYYKKRGYNLLTLKTCAGGHGCNEFVFQRNN
jgi:2-polyprenyl-6-hydroxyphenyl methylase/3-demethylubiquinone-9 3-methyltransferase